MRSKHSIHSLLALFLATTIFLGYISRFQFLLVTRDPIGFLELLGSLTRGLVFDAAVTLYVFTPVALLALLPQKFWQSRILQITMAVYFYLFSAIFAFATLSESFFEQEFNSRFNFIAVDYLVYTNEVLKNIWESYPLWWIVPVFLVLHFAFAAFAYRFFLKISFRPASVLTSFGLLLGALVCAVFLSEAGMIQGVDSVEAEVAKNPVHALFAAFRNNEISFKRFYASVESSRAAHSVHEAFEEDIAGLPDKEDENEDETSIVRNIFRPGPEKKLNVVLILMESMSAKFLNTYGSNLNLTPNLDRLAQSGLFFDRVYSTGTRTVRGIEAVTLSMPPTPGQSIVRRPEAGSIFNLGSVFRLKGYQTQFVYGGRAFFDNMATFFSENGFEVFDQSTMQKSDIQFSNAWGVCDEDLFRYAIKNADQMSGNPFFQFILTTSNHRPYTYPEGKIDIPSHTGREGAIKYSDYAIGEYLKVAEKKPWFKDTIFIFVADHNASVAGSTEIFPKDYRIPMIFYSPAHIEPKKNSILGSQIDLAPTLFGLLNFSYQSRFFGHDLERARTERAFLATYQVVGLWRPGEMALLSPNRLIRVYKMQDEKPSLTRAFKATFGQKFDDPLIEETVGYYEAASDWFDQNLLKEKTETSRHINSRSH